MGYLLQSLSSCAASPSPAQAPSQYALCSKDLLANAFLFEEAVERRSAVIECFIAVRCLDSMSPLSRLFLFLRANSKLFNSVFFAFFDGAVQHNHTAVRINIEQHPALCGFGRSPCFENAVIEGPAYWDSRNYKLIDSIHSSSFSAHHSAQWMSLSTASASLRRQA